MGLGSEIRKKLIPGPGVKKALDPGFGSATLLERKPRKNVWRQPSRNDTRVTHDINFSPEF
jgi:hypothetical protein